MIQKLLLGYDGSDSAKLAYDFALDLAVRYQCEFHIVAVVRPPEFGSDVETEALIENARHRMKTMLKELEARSLPGAPVPAIKILVGHPAEQIVRYAEGHAIDHIVVGHRGHTLFERWLIGSVARQVIAYAHCAVTVVRD